MRDQWPIWRTAPRRLWPISLSVLISAAVLTWLAPVLLGGLVLGVLHAIGATNAGWLTFVIPPGYVAVYGGIVSWAFLLAGVPLARFALRKGYAGWAVAMLSGLGLSCLGILLLPDSGLFNASLMAPFFLSSGAAHGGLFWLMVRWMSPEAIAPR